MRYFHDFRRLGLTASRALVGARICDIFASAGNDAYDADVLGAIANSLRGWSEHQVRQWLRTHRGAARAA